MAERLAAAQIDQWLAGRSGWAYDGETIAKQFQFANFRGAIAFVNAGAELAEAADHHPDIAITYNKVRIALTTHDAGGVTQQDLDLAAQLDGTTLVRQS